MDEANAWYKGEIRKFDNALVKKIMKQPHLSGAIAPEEIVDLAVRNGRPTKVKQLFATLPENTRNNVRRVAMERLLSKMSGAGPNPMEDVFKPMAFTRAIEDMGDSTLKVLFDEKTIADLKTLDKVMRLTTQRQAMSGGLVAAHIALHPLQNIGRLAQLRVMSKFMNSETGRMWLTVGLKAPKTRTGGIALTRVATQLKALADEESREGRLE